MQYPSKRLTLNGHPMTPDVVPTMVEYGYDTLMIFKGGAIPERVAALEPALCNAEEYGIKVLVSCQEEIGGDVPAGSRNPTWMVSDYEAAYGVVYDLLEADSRIDGYFGETPTYVGSQWLAGRTSKLMVYDYTCCTESWAHFSDIISLYDEVVDEAFFPNWATIEFPSIIPTLYSIKPTLKIGVWDQTLNLWPTDGDSYWGSTWTLVPPPVPYATQQSLAITAFNAINVAMMSTFHHKLDFNVVQYAGVNELTVNETLIQAIEWHDAQHLTYTGTPVKPVQQMNQKGHIPAYGGTSICTYPPTLVDTFTNTGNEIIMLKNYGSGCAMHRITVSGSDEHDAPNEIDYTIALSPNHASILGPFPLKDFGELLTIDYDTTNLYVAVLKSGS